MLKRQGILSGILFGATVVSRTFLLFVLAKYLSLEDLGIFGLFQASILIGVTLAGLGFHHFSLRHLLQRQLRHWPRRIVDQAAFMAASMAVVSAGMVALAVSGMIPPQYGGWLVTLFVLSFLDEEVLRLIRAMRKPVFAAVARFIGTGLWGFPLMGLIIFDLVPAELPTVWAAATIGHVATIVLGIVAMRELPWFTIRRKRSIDWRYVRRGIAGGLVLFLAIITSSLTIRGNRYLIEVVCGTGTLGIFTFYSSIARNCSSAVAAGISGIYHPIFVRSFLEGRREEYRSMLRRSTLYSFGAATLLAVGILAVIDPLLTLIGKPQISASVEVLYLLLAAEIVFVTGQGAHFALYVRHADRHVLVSQIIGFIAMVALQILLGRAYGVAGAAGAHLAVVAIVAACKGSSLWLYDRGKPPQRTPIDS